MARIATAFILFAFTGGALLLGILPVWDRIGSTRAEIERLQALHGELVALAEQRAALTEEYGAIPESDLEKLRTVAPARPQSAELLGDLELLAAQNALTLDRVDFTGERSGSLTPTAARRYRSIPVTLNIRGSYEAFQAFLRALEEHARLFDVEEVNFSTTGGAATLSVSLRGQIYQR